MCESTSLEKSCRRGVFPDIARTCKTALLSFKTDLISFRHYIFSSYPFTEHFFPAKDLNTNTYCVQVLTERNRATSCGWLAP
jgi:hypothetical protein